MYDTVRQGNVKDLFGFRVFQLFMNTILHMTLDCKECMARAQMKKNNDCTVKSMPQRQADAQADIYQIN